jgi:hypothetical protein
MMSRVVVLVPAIACCYLCGRIAEHRGRSIKAWVWLGAIFGAPCPATRRHSPASRPGNVSPSVRH